MSVAQQRGITGSAAPCPMCGNRRVSDRGECSACGEVLFVPEPPLAAPGAVETSPTLHRVLGTIVLSLTLPSAAGAALGLHAEIETGRIDGVLTRTAVLAPLCYGVGVGVYQLVLGQAPRHHRWRTDVGRAD